MNTNDVTLVIFKNKYEKYRGFWAENPTEVVGASSFPEAVDLLVDSINTDELVHALRPGPRTINDNYVRADAWVSRDMGAHWHGEAWLVDKRLI